MKHLVIIHGWGNTRAQDHWQRHLAVSARKAGHAVHYPQLPDTETPNFADWAEVLIAEFEMIADAKEPDDEIVVVTHSLGCSTFLKLAVDGHLPLAVDRLLMVAPADPSVLSDVASFIVEPTELVRAALEAHASKVVLLGSDADVWTPNGVQATYGDPLGLEAVILEGAKHLALGDGWGYWRGVIDWVNDPSANLAVR